MESKFDENFWEAVNTECQKDILGAVMDFKYERITASELMEYIAFRCEISARLAIDKKGQPMTLIEKLEALPTYSYHKEGFEGFIFPALKGEYIKTSALRAIIEQAKAEQAEPVAYINVEKRNLEWAKPIVFHTALCGSYPKVPLYIAPQPTPDQSERIAELEAQRDRLLQALGQTAKAVIGYSDHWHDKGDLDKANKYNLLLGEHQDLIKEIEASK